MMADAHTDAARRQRAGTAGDGDAAGRPVPVIARLIAARIDELQPRLTRYAQHLTRDPVAADDLVQQTFARAIERSHQWQPGTRLLAWLVTIMHNLFVSGVRRAVREGARVQLSDAEHLLVCPAAQDSDIGLRELLRAIAALPHEQRTVLALVTIGGHEYGDVAAALDIPTGTVRSRLWRARARLREAAGLAPNARRAVRPSAPRHHPTRPCRTGGSPPDRRSGAVGATIR